MRTSHLAILALVIVAHGGFGLGIPAAAPVEAEPTVISVPIAAPEPGGACFRREVVDTPEGPAPVLASIPSRDCYRFQPPERMRGIWINDFEGSRFIKGARILPHAEEGALQVWLEIDERSVAPAELVSEESLGKAYYIEFKGRPASDMDRYPGEGYGHMGMARGLVLVDRVERFHRLPRRTSAMAGSGR